MSVREVSIAGHFNALPCFSQAVSGCFGHRPSEYRRAWPETDSDPADRTSGEGASVAGEYRRARPEIDSAPSRPRIRFSFVERTRLARRRSGAPDGAGRSFMVRGEWP